MKEENVWIVMLLIFVAGLYVGYRFYPYIAKTEYKYTGKIPESVDDIVNICNNKTLFNSTKCVVAVVRSFYKYKDTDDGIRLSFEELKDRGGDCRDWALLYEDIGKKLGFESVSFSIKTPPNYHRFTVWSVGDGYCIIDQKSFWCVKFLKNE